MVAEDLINQVGYVVDQLFDELFKPCNCSACMRMPVPLLARSNSWLLRT